MCYSFNILRSVNRSFSVDILFNTLGRTLQIKIIYPRLCDGSATFWPLKPLRTIIVLPVKLEFLAIVYTAKKWLNCGTGVLAQVFTLFLRLGVACTQQVSWAPVNVQTCNHHHIQVFWTSVDVLANALSAGRARALVYAQFIHYLCRTRMTRFN